MEALTSSARTRAAIYARVSSDPKRRWRSVQEQEAECRAWAEREGWQVVKVFSDNDRGASRFSKTKRPAFSALQDFIAAGRCDVLLTWEGSRGQRDLTVYTEIRRLSEKTKTRWAYDGQVFDMTKARDRKRTAEDAVEAEYEADRTSERVCRAMRANAADGKPHGPIPYGYRREYDPETRALIGQFIREDQAAVICEAADRFLSGETPYAIANDLNRRKVPAPRGGDWNLTQVRRMLTNPTNIGRRTHQGQDMGKGTWLPVLDEGVFHRCVAKFADPARKTTHEHSIKFLLSGIATCGVCGARIKIGRPRGYSSYICSAKFCVARKLGAVDDLIGDLIVARLSQPDALGLLAAGGDDDSSAAMEELEGLRARLDSLYEEVAEGRLTAGALAKIEPKIVAKIERCEATAQSQTAIPAVVFDLATDPAKRWKAITLEQRREVVRTLMTVEILLTRQGGRVFDPESVRVTWRGLPEA